MRKGVNFWGVVVSLTVILAIFWGVALAEQIFEDPKSDRQVAQSKVNTENPKLLFCDNFSADSAMWKYVGDAYRDPVNEYVVLTENVNGQVGVIWLNRRITSPFTVEFKYRAGGGSGADGLTFMFYKQTSYEPSNGGSLGFMNRNEIPIYGYALEFDNWYNTWDPSSNHIALIKDHVNNHLISVSDPRTEDNLWHDVSVVVNVSEIRVDVDNSTLFTWLGTSNTTYGGFGFSASTGDANNRHIIDDVNLIAEFEPPIPDTYEPDDYYPLANYISVTGARQPHDFHVPGDSDWLKFNASGGSSYVIETADLGPESDTYLYLYDTNGTTELRHDDDSGLGLASKINWHCSDSGTYYIKVRHYSPLVSGPETRYNISVNHTVLPARLNDLYSDRGLNTDSGDLYDYLAIDVGVNVSTSGNYSVEVDLRALDGTPLTENSTYLYLPAGNQTVTVMLDGVEIRVNKVNGPFVLDDVWLRDDSDNLVDYRDDPFITHYYNYTDFRRPIAELGTDLKDYGLDIDSNGLYDYLVIEKQINVTTAGNYELDGYLINDAGLEIDSVDNYTYLNAGLHNMTLRFSGYKIHNSKSSGNFTVYMELYGYLIPGLPASIDSEIIEKSLVEKERITGPELAESNDAHISRDSKPLAVSSQQQVDVSAWRWLDSAEDLTSYYSYAQFDRPPARFNDVYADYGLDTDSNSFYEYLAIDVGVNVSKSGYYGITGELYNSSGWYVGGVSNYTTLHAGNQTVQLRFNGPRIWQSRTNGTFALRYLSLHNVTVWSQLDYRYAACTTEFYNYTDFRPPAVFMPGVRDYGYDEDGNGLYDYLVIEKQINVTAAGNYELDGNLYNDSGYGIDTNYNYTYLNAGLQNITLKFRGYKIYNSKSTGNFTVYMNLYGYLIPGLPASIDSEIIEKSSVENESITGQGLAENNDATISQYSKPLAVSSQQQVGVSWWGRLDSIEDLTSSYSYAQFDRPPARFNDVYSDYGLDTDSNGFYDYLAIDVGVNASKPGYYRISGSLYNASGYYVGGGSNYTTLPAGNQTVQLRFYGPRIWQSRTNGTFDLRYLNLYNATDWSQLDYRYAAYTTKFYNYTDFRPPAVFMPGVRDYGYDEDGNGFFEYLVIDKQINVTAAGNYELNGDLHNDSGYWIDSNYNYTYLSTGLQNITLKFRGYKIYNSKSTGNFTVYMNLYGNSTAAPLASSDSGITEKLFEETKDIIEPRLAEINAATISQDSKPLAVSSNQPVGASSWGTLDSIEDITSYYSFSQFEPPVPDAYEPDDNYSMANYISVTGVKQTHDFHVPGDHDWLKFNASRGSSYTIETTDLGPGSDTYLYLYDTNGTTELRRDDDSGVGLASKIGWYCGDSGTYYILVEHFSHAASGPETSYNISVVHVFFDTGPSAKPYPSLSGTYNGTIMMTHTVNANKIFSYPCTGTGGHIKYAKIWNTSWDGAEAHWNGYVDDWHNLPFDKNFTLRAGETYNYTIQTGSYPQNIHEQSWNATGGRITCTEFTDANGRTYDNWIPAIRLY